MKNIFTENSSIPGSHTKDLLHVLNLFPEVICDVVPLVLQ